MATAYFKEQIERITEQTLEEEIKDELRKIKEDAVVQINNIKDSANSELESLEQQGMANCDKTRDEAISAIEKTRNDFVTYTANEKRDMIFTLGENDANGNPAVRGKLRKIDSDTNDIYENIKKVAPDTEAVIENDIRRMIVNNGYFIEIVNDGKGNVTTNIGQVV
jgi:hypothetical protein